MKAVLLTGHGGLEKLQYREDVPIPEPESGEALIRVHACGLNNTDINTRTAWYSKEVEQGITETAVITGFDESSQADASWGNNQLTFPRIQGADVCGVVERVNGAGSTPASNVVANEVANTVPNVVGKRVLVDPWLLDQNNPGDLSKARYLGSEVDGGYAQYIVAPVENIHPIETSLSNEELATFACAYSTAENLISRTGLTEGETIVISGASGGVGSAAIQLAKIRSAQVIAISSPGKEQKLKEMGADYVI